jgi:hypothetical protein
MKDALVSEQICGRKGLHVERDGGWSCAYVRLSKSQSRANDKGSRGH